MIKPFKKLLHSRPFLWFRERQENQERHLTRIFSPLLIVGTILLLTLLLAYQPEAGHVYLRVGEVSPREIRAGRSVFYVDTTKTRRLQEAAAEAVRPVFDPDDKAYVQALRTVAQLFERMQAERAALQAHSPIRAIDLHNAVVSSQFTSLLPPDALRRMLTLPEPVFQRLQQVTNHLVSAAMEREIRDQGPDLKDAIAQTSEVLDNALPDAQDRVIARMVIEHALRPNLHFDARKTEQAREAAMHSVRPYIDRVFMGDRILAPGEIVTQQALDKLTALGLVNPREELATNVAIAVLTVLMVLSINYYIAVNLPQVYRNRRRMALLWTIVVLAVFGLKAGAVLFGMTVSNGQPGYLSIASVTAMGMLVCALIDMNLAVLLVAVMAALTGILMNHEVRFTVMTLVSGLVGIMGVQVTKRKNRLLMLLLTLAIVNVAMVWLLGMLFDDEPADMLRGTLWAIILTAPVATFLYWIGTLALEKPFGLLTPSLLMELSSTDHPLLQKLCTLAPGTYAHSMMVGTLAEAAARAIGADALLCRIGGYYHDIGKMDHPEFFVENQRRENVHSRLSPSLSAIIIIAHVRDGVKIAKAARLPQEICDIIEQHHGTTLISYFYHRALMDNGGGDEMPPGFEKRFRYSGPKPQTREAAIVMMADSVEAAARSLENPDPEQLHRLVEEILHNKAEDGQFDECPLTFRDMRLISDAFLRILQAICHRRVPYPNQGSAPAKPDALVTFDANLPIEQEIERKDVSSSLLLEPYIDTEASVLSSILPEGAEAELETYAHHDLSQLSQESSDATTSTRRSSTPSKRRKEPRRGEHSADK